MAIFYIDSGSFGNVSITNLTAPNYVLNSSTSSFITNTQTGVFLTTGSSGTSQTINGSLIINQNLTVLGSSSITNITSSQLNIGTNLITVNTSTPGIRFGGLSVIDSGSSPQRSGSILFDSINDQWIFVHQASTAVTSSLFIMGPETYNNVGNETTLTNNKIPKSVNAEHIGDSNITDTGTVIQLGSNTQLTGSLTIQSTLTTFTSSITTAGINTLFTQSTSSYNSAFSKYVVLNGVNARAGEFMAVWNSGSITYTDIATTDIGSTTTIIYSSSFSGANILLQASASAGWNIKMLTTFI